MTPIVLDEEDLAYIKGFDLAISDCYSNLDPAEIQKINDLGVPFAYDFSEEFTEEILKEYCPHVDYCFLSCNQQGNIHTEHLLGQQPWRNIAIRYPLCQPLNDGCLADPCLPHQAGIIFLPAGQYLHHPFQLPLTPHYGIEQSLIGQGSQVAAEALQQCLFL